MNAEPAGDPGTPTIETGLPLNVLNRSASGARATPSISSSLRPSASEPPVPCRLTTIRYVGEALYLVANASRVLVTGSEVEVFWRVPDATSPRVWRLNTA